MSRVAITSTGDVDFGGLVSHLLEHHPSVIEKLMFPSTRSHHETRNGEESKGNIPVDIVETPKELVMYMDVPGLSKSDIQVTVEEENLLVVRSNGKRKREEKEDEEGFKYLRLERRTGKMVRKFRLPKNCNVSAITAKCENGVLTVVVEKIPPAPKSKTVEVKIS
ncbi:17.4 kDa class III heat shock protein-like [Bidens hawaiensis]|uniref:17.4 kDa class III heat shock protein-like n=1 Tax=Bidens hawaiensis TaxID=980011 RepID=UPI00404A605A